MKKILSIVLLLIITIPTLCACDNVQTLTASSQTYSEPEKSDTSEQPIESEASYIDTSSVYNFDKKYFVNKLDDKLLDLFVQMYDFIMDFGEYFEFKQMITEEELSVLMYLLNYDCPEIIQINGDYYPEYSSGQEISAVTFSYIMEESEYKDYIDKLNSFFDELRTTLDGKSDYEKEKYVYDYIFNTCVYDETDVLSGSVCGVILNHKGRCEAISKAMEWCMNELDIECMTVVGEPLWDVDAVYSYHSWNIIKIEGEYYHLDLTIDNINYNQAGENFPFYDFFNVTDDYIYETHLIYDLYAQLGVPICNSSEQNYHILNNLYIYENNDLEAELTKVISENFTDDTTSLSVKFEDGEDYSLAVENSEEYINNIISNISDKSYVCNIWLGGISYIAVYEFAQE